MYLLSDSLLSLSQGGHLECFPWELPWGHPSPSGMGWQGPKGAKSLEDFSFSLKFFYPVLSI